jgi:hypothetical protein
MSSHRFLIAAAGLIAIAAADCARDNAAPTPDASAETSAARPDISGTWVHPAGPGGGSLRPADGFPLTPWALEKMKKEKPTAAREHAVPAEIYSSPGCSRYGFFCL